MGDLDITIVAVGEEDPMAGGNGALDDEDGAGLGEPGVVACPGGGAVDHSDGVVGGGVGCGSSQSARRLRRGLVTTAVWRCESRSCT